MSRFRNFKTSWQFQTRHVTGILESSLMNSATKAVLDVAGKIELDGKEYDTDQLSEVGLRNLSLFRFVVARENEISNNLALLQRAKNSYIDSLKNEMISSKAGFLFDDN